MSLGDELRLLRAKAGGPTPFEIEEATSIDPGLYRQLEQRYREMGSDQTIETLAAYFGCDPDALKRARGRSRKALSQHVNDAQSSGSLVSLQLRSGEVLRGRVTSWDLGCIGLLPVTGGPLVIVQRHAVIDW
jgi:transcriptional regulator with XRE-family HTH domain